MASFSKLVITDTGKNLLNDAFALGEKVNFTNASVSEISYQEEELQALCQLPEIKQTVSIHNITRDEDIIEMMVEFDNDDLAAGYYLRTLGIYANIGGGEEFLFAVAKEKTENLFVPAGEVAVSGVNMKLKIQLENADIVQLVVDRASVATLGDILMVRDELSMHFQDRNNPHGVTKSQVGLGNVDNTADTEKPVSTAQQTALNSYYQQSTGYTDQKIADLINGAPETLDTLKEVADAIQENETVVEALDAAIGKKSDQAELDGHVGNEVIHITATERTKWNMKCNEDLLNMVYPVGSIYMSVTNVSPASFIGGEWESWGAGRVPVGVDVSQTEFSTVNYPGGNKSIEYIPSGTVGSHVLTISEIPSHSHGMSHTHTTPATATGAQSANHTHTVSGGSCSIPSSGSHAHVVKGSKIGASGTERAIPSGEGANDYAAIDSSGAHTHTVPAHAHTVGNNSVGHTHTLPAMTTNSINTTTTGGSGGGSGHNHEFTGTASNISTVQPYITCYMWKRTA